MSIKPNAKPMVLGWLNPLANGRLTLKQNKTKQEGVGLVLKTKPNPLTCLSVNLSSKVTFLASSFCWLVLRGLFERRQSGFTQLFNRVFHNQANWG